MEVQRLQCESFPMGEQVAELRGNRHNAQLSSIGLGEQRAEILAGEDEGATNNVRSSRAERRAEREGRIEATGLSSLATGNVDEVWAGDVVEEGREGGGGKLETLLLGPGRRIRGRG